MGNPWWGGWMARVIPSMRAIEARGGIRSAIADWKRNFRKGTKPSRYPIGAFWDEDQRYWAKFLPEGEGSSTSFRTFLGIRANGLVELNVPFIGNNPNVQGVVAVDPQGDRWLLHHGRLHPGTRRVSADEFGAVAGPAHEVLVDFKDGSARRYFRVADIDAEPMRMRAQLGDFLRLCERVRIHYTVGAAAAAMLDDIDQWERQLFPETSGAFVRPAQAEKIGERWHGDVVNQLASILEGKGLKVANQRIGRYGPDLYTACKTPKLFEIKTDHGPAHVQQGIGQLALYEQLRGAQHLKVLVLPRCPGDALAKCLDQLGVKLLTYRRERRAVVFDPGQLDAVLA